VLTEVAAGDELSRLQIPIVQAPLDPTLSAINLQADMVPLEASGSELLMGVTQSRKDTRGDSQSPPTSETRLLRFVMAAGRWLAVASEPISSDESAPSCSGPAVEKSPALVTSAPALHTEVSGLWIPDVFPTQALASWTELVNSLAGR
jgi:hypothetical protein